MMTLQMITNDDSPDCIKYNTLGMMHTGSNCIAYDVIKQNLVSDGLNDGLTLGRLFKNQERSCGDTL